MRRICAGAAAAAALVLTSASASAKQGPALALVWNGSVVSLTRVDPMSLRSSSASVAVGTGAHFVARSPRGAILAFDAGRGAVLSLVDTAPLRPRGSVELGEGWIGAAAWPSPRRLVAVVGTEAGTKVVTVDPAVHRKIGERSLPAHQMLLRSAAGDRVVFLTSESQSIAPVRLGVAGIDGAVRTVLLARIAGGTQLPADPSTAAVTSYSPALTVEPGGRRAAIVGAAGLVAEVDLNTLAVTYHPGALRKLARAAKAMQGWQRSALWLSSGTIAVTGMDYSATVANGQEEMTETPAGLTLVDTRDWTSRPVDAGAAFLTRAGDTLVAYGAPAFSTKPSPGGIGLRGYSPSGALRFQLFGTEQIGEVQTAGGLVYVTGCANRCFRIVDPVSGTLAGTAETLRPTQLVSLQP
jgi:hypothetical protein